MAAKPQHGNAISPSRRAFLNKLSLALSGIIGILVGLPVIGFLIEPLFKQFEMPWQSVGPEQIFKVGTTVEVVVTDPSPVPWTGLTAQTAVWLRRVSEEQFIAFSVTCTHLGCPVSWLSDAELFMCPCHGGVYYSDGQVAAGPPPHSLPTFPVKVEGGVVKIQFTGIPV